MTTVADDARARAGERGELPGPSPGLDQRRTSSAVDSARARSREFATDEEQLADVARQRAVQRMLFDAGLAGIIVPKEVRRGQA